jgi:hypothetical protein
MSAKWIPRNDIDASKEILEVGDTVEVRMKIRDIDVGDVGRVVKIYDPLQLLPWGSTFDQRIYVVNVPYKRGVDIWRENGFPACVACNRQDLVYLNVEATTKEVERVESMFAKIKSRLR